MHDDTGDQATLTAFTEPTARDLDAPEPGEHAASEGEDFLGRVDARLVQLEAMVPGIEPFSDSWGDLTPKEREALLAARLEIVRKHLDDALPAEDPQTASIGFE
jgi:hypothetical protein